MEYRFHISASEIDERQWQQLVADSPTATFFQTREFYRFLSSIPSFRPFVFGLSEGDKLQMLACGYLVSEKGLARYFSRRAIVLGGILLSQGSTKDGLSFFLQEMTKNLSNEAIYIEIRNNHPFDGLKDTFGQSGFGYCAHYNFKIDTATDALAAVSRNKLRDEQTALRKGVTVIGQPSQKEVVEWYGILHDLYKTRVKKPLFPLDFFLQVSQLPNTRFFMVKVHDKIVGGTLCLCWNEMMYEWYACGLDRGEFKHYFPSTVATMASIRYAEANGYRCFDMLGAGVPDEHYGVRDFKNHFGGKLVEEGRFLYICNKFLYKLGTFAIKLKMHIL